MIFQDKKGHFTSKENDGGECLHNISGKNTVEKRAIPKEEFFGERFDGYVGADAVEKLLKEKRGYVKGAFYRREVGDIDLVWGNDDGGLKHLIHKRDKMFKSGQGHIQGVDMARKIPEIIEKGKLVPDSQGRFNYEYQNYRVGVKPMYDGEKVNWVVSAMEIIK